MNNVKFTPDWFMMMALKEAKKAYRKGEVPVGAIIAKDNKIIARGHNKKETQNNSVLHAEIVAISAASKKLGWRLNGCEMYVTLEPCIMCAGAILNARVSKLFIGAEDPKMGAVGSIINVLELDNLNHKVMTVYDIMKPECSSIIKNFFKELRRANNAN